MVIYTIRERSASLPNVLFLALEARDEVDEVRGFAVDAAAYLVHTAVDRAG